MQNLEEIYISGTEVTSVPWQWSLLSRASTIDIRDTRVCEVPWILNENLETLRLPDCADRADWSRRGITGLEVITRIGKAKEVMGAFRRLRRIDLSHNKLNELPDFRSAEWPLLQFVDASHNEITSFRSHETVEVRILGNPVDTVALQFDTVRMHKRLKELDRQLVRDVSIFYKMNVDIRELLFEGLRKLVVFPNSGVNGSIPAYVGKLTNLTYMNIGYNSLRGSLPSALGLLTGLRVLNLKYNLLTGGIIQLSSLSSLSELDLRRNELTGTIPDVSALTGLRELGLRSTNVCRKAMRNWSSTGVCSRWVH